jgi:siroheme synthase
MVANMRVRNMDDLCVGEPRSHRAVTGGISAATKHHQRHAVCTLGTLCAVVQQQALPSPAVMATGDVAAAASAHEAIGPAQTAQVA